MLSASIRRLALLVPFGPSPKMFSVAVAAIAPLASNSSLCIRRSVELTGLSVTSPTPNAPATEPVTVPALPPRPAIVLTTRPSNVFAAPKLWLPVEVFD
ncbi:hypothetical protein Hhel01_04318 [Haloferula helveola]